MRMGLSTHNTLCCESFASHFPCRLFCQQRQGMLRDHQLLVSRHDEEYNPALRPRNERFAFCIGRRIQNDAEPCKLLRDAGADRWRILTNRGPLPQRGRQHPRIQTDAVNEVVDGESRARIRTRLEISHVIADTGQPFQTALTIE